MEGEWRVWTGCGGWGARPSQYHTELSHRDYISFLPVYLPSGFPVKMLMPLTGKDVGALGPQSPSGYIRSNQAPKEQSPEGKLIDNICVGLLDAGEILSL